MRRDLERSAAAANGSSPIPLAKSNGFAHANGGSGGAHVNGSLRGGGLGTEPAAGAFESSFFGHKREEVSRLMIQALQDLGYHDSANALVRESGHELESPTVAAFRFAVLNGEWSEAEAYLFGVADRDEGGVRISNGHSSYQKPLPLAEGVDRNELRFQLRRQKYLELLEQGDQTGALVVLRQELTPLHRDVSQLHSLSSLVVRSADDLKAQTGWDGAEGDSRNQLLSELSKSISPSVMIPEHRLAALLDQVKQSQISKCHYHNPTSALSLFADHSCDRSQFPLQSILHLSQTAEVWFLEFSPDGSRLATSGQDSAIVIYDAVNFKELHLLVAHSKHVAYVTWSPDGSRLVSCSHDRTARIWDPESGKCITVLQNFSEPVTTAAWTPDGQSFVTGSLDKKASLTLWSVTGEKQFTWSALYRVQDLAISPDGAHLVTVSVEKQIFVYDLSSRAEEYSLRLKTDMTCVSISRDSRHMLVNMADNELQLIDIRSAEIVQRFLGQKQGRYVIRSAFGGADENLVISGSENGKIYIFHRERGTIIETLEGHMGGCVNAVAWNPADSCMFASAGDDKKVRIWSKPNNPVHRLTPNSSISSLRRNPSSYSTSATYL